jgi:hypothetical protein
LWDFINPNPNPDQMVTSEEPRKPTEPQQPQYDPNDPNLSLFNQQKYSTDSTRYEREFARFEKHQKHMKELRGFILDTTYIGHRPLIRDLQSIKEMLEKLKGKFAPKERREKALLTERANDLATPKSGTKPRNFSKEWRDLIVDMNLANYSEIPKFHEIWSNRLIEFDLDMATSGLTKDPDIDSVIDAFDLWTENFVKPKQSSTQDIT